MGFKVRKQWKSTGWIPEGENTLKKIRENSGAHTNPNHEVVFRTKSDITCGLGLEARKVRISTTIEIEEV